MIEVVSFDLDGTLVDRRFAESFWYEGIPRLYAERWGLNPEEARREVTRRYDEIGMERLEWYDINYWWKEFGLGGSWTDLAEECRTKVRAYPEVHEVLGGLHRRFKLIVITNAARELAKVELEQARLNDYFDRMFSATSDFGLVKKTGEFYSDVLRAIGVSPAGVVHVRDNWVFDYLAPREAGIRAFFLDRDGEQPGEFVVRDLREFSRQLSASEPEHKQDVTKKDKRGPPEGEERLRAPRKSEEGIPGINDCSS
jgi:putative hydrolase of the HAD superfamily